MTLSSEKLELPLRIRKGELSQRIKAGKGKLFGMKYIYRCPQKIRRTSRRNLVEILVYPPKFWDYCLTSLQGSLPGKVPDQAGKNWQDCTIGQYFKRYFVRYVPQTIIIAMCYLIRINCNSLISRVPHHYQSSFPMNTHVRVLVCLFAILLLFPKRSGSCTTMLLSEHLFYLTKVTVHIGLILFTKRI